MYFSGCLLFGQTFKVKKLAKKGITTCLFLNILTHIFFCAMYDFLIHCLTEWHRLSRSFQHFWSFSSSVLCLHVGSEVGSLFGPSKSCKAGRWFRLVHNPTVEGYFPALYTKPKPEPRGRRPDGLGEWQCWGAACVGPSLQSHGGTATEKLRPKPCTHSYS